MLKRRKILLDTNILVDFLAHRQPYYVPARKLIILGAIGEFELWVSASQINDVFYIISEGGKAALSTNCQDRLRQCREFIHICSVTEEDIDAALALNLPDLEDASVLVCADKINADAIVSRDREFPTSKYITLDADAYFKHLQEYDNISYQEMTMGIDG